MTDWAKIKKEYISGNVSQQALCKKYGISTTQIADKSKKENWVKQREAYRDAKTVREIQATADKEIDRYKRMLSVTDKLLQKIEEQIDNLEGELTPSVYKQYTSAIKDIKEIQSIKSEADRKEQEARIQKLLKDAESEQDNSKEIVIHIEGDKTSWQV
jgi:hypothetical protein